ncbi:hypothetical protein [Streptosporangium sp. NPDC002524]|uniref:hypothetical protein n=1 Tax=Streptosporangium sp. NPDC002524 TaxID=3154537 RepID=UPI0033259803
MPTPPADFPVPNFPLPDRPALEALLGKAFGAPVVLDHVEHLAPWAVLRAHLAGPDAGKPMFPTEPDAGKSMFPAGPDTETPAQPIEPNVETPMLPAGPGDETPAYPAGPDAGKPTFSGGPESGPPSHPARPSSGPPGSVIVKWLRSDPSGSRMDPGQVVTERAALRFLSEDLGLHLAPRVLADDMAASLLVLEDLAPRTPLDRVLRRDGAVPAAAGLAAFARALGELGAATAGHAERYLARRPVTGLGLTCSDAEAWRRAVEHGAGLGVALPGRAETELARLLAELADPGPFLALTNGDAEANNFLTTDGFLTTEGFPTTGGFLTTDGFPATDGDDHADDYGDGRLIDFEFAGYRHALTSAVCLYVPGPAWLTVSDPIATGLEAGYRSALARGVPEADDDHLFGSGLASACLTWAATRFTRFPTLDARPPGENSRLQMVFTLDAAARAAEHHRALPHLSGWARRVAQVLRRRWPDTDVDRTAYPAYTPRR